MKCTDVCRLITLSNVNGASQHCGVRGLHFKYGQAV